MLLVWWYPKVWDGFFATPPLREPGFGETWETRGKTYSQTSKGDTGAGSRGLVHLTEDKRHLGLAVELNDTSLLHFVVQVVTLTSTLADTAEHGVTTVGLSDVVLKRC